MAYLINQKLQYLFPMARIEIRQNIAFKTNIFLFVLGIFYSTASYSQIGVELLGSNPGIQYDVIEDNTTIKFELYSPQFTLITLSKNKNRISERVLQNRYDRYQKSILAYRFELWSSKSSSNTTKEHKEIPKAKGVKFKIPISTEKSCHQCNCKTTS